MKKVNLGLFKSQNAQKNDKFIVAKNPSSSGNSQSMSQSQSKQIKDTQVQRQDATSLKQSKINTLPKEQNQMKPQSLPKPNLLKLFAKYQKNDIAQKIQKKKPDQVKNQPKLNISPYVQVQQQEKNKQAQTSDTKKVNPFMLSKPSNTNANLLFPSKPSQSIFGNKLIQANTQKNSNQKPQQSLFSFPVSKNNIFTKEQPNKTQQVTKGIYGQAQSSIFGQPKTNMFGQSTSSLFPQPSTDLFGRSNQQAQKQQKTQKSNLLTKQNNQSNNMFGIKKSDQPIKGLKLFQRLQAEKQSIGQQTKEIKQQSFKNQANDSNKHDTMIDQDQDIEIRQKNLEKIKKTQKSQQSKIQNKLRKQRIQAQLQYSKQKLLSLLKKGDRKVTINNPISEILPSKLNKLKQSYAQLQNQNTQLANNLFSLCSQKKALQQQLLTYQSSSSLSSILYPKLSIHFQQCSIPRVTQIIDYNEIKKQIDGLVNEVKQNWKDQEGKQLFLNYYEANRMREDLKQKRTNLILQTESYLQRIQHQQINRSLNVAPKPTKIPSPQPILQIQSSPQKNKNQAEMQNTKKQPQSEQLSNQSKSKDQTDKQIQKRQTQLRELRQRSALLKDTYDQLRRKVKQQGSKLLKISSISGKSQLIRSEIY